MKRFIFTFFIFIFSFAAAQSVESDSASTNNYEHILSFNSDIKIDKDSRVTITEKIKVYAAGINIRRGIFRSLPLWRNINGKKIRIKYDLISVQKDGVKEKYHTKKSGSDYIIYFGNKNKILTPGIYSYELTYETTDQIGFFKDYDEFYWNVNGALWDYKIDEISATLTLPESAKITQFSCYTGSYGSNQSNCTSTKIAATSMAWSANNLNQNEGLTIAAGFNKGVFNPPLPPTFLEKYGVTAALLLTAILLLMYFYNTWQKYGVDPQKPVVYPQFNSPQDLSPASLGFLEKGYYGGHLISSAIVSLAIKGYLKIIEDDKRILGIFGGKEYTLEKIKEADQTLPKEEINLMNKFFNDGSATISFDGKYSSKIENAVNDFKASLRYQHEPYLKKGNNSNKLILPFLVIAGLYIGGLFLSHRLTYSEGHLVGGIILGVALLVLGIVISAFFERSKIVKVFFILISVGLIFLVTTLFIGDQNRNEKLGFYGSYAFLIFGFITMVIYQYLIKQPTPEKLETLSLIEGFKMYLGTAEEKTLQFHNPPEMTPAVFEKMLPYAMVLGVDKIWGEKFQNMLKNSALGQQEYHSNWFIGSSIMHMNFAQSLNSSLSQSIASSSTQPSSSGSGSGGGGFSGGGGGGGGGGGW